MLFLTFLYSPDESPSSFYFPFEKVFFLPVLKVITVFTEGIVIIELSNQYEVRTFRVTYIIAVVSLLGGHLFPSLFSVMQRTSRQHAFTMHQDKTCAEPEQEAIKL